MMKSSQAIELRLDLSMMPLSHLSGTADEVLIRREDFDFRSARYS